MVEIWNAKYKSWPGCTEALCPSVRLASLNKHSLGVIPYTDLTD